ncbi:hypothetical protein E2C01_059911 [Portunus trituberculatus]|uniref:Uncharacterized protein n=1 Tax=Portunus trituberculatus TaxID=210409 RepID=A0A5B7H7X0_PORTR|nr:hypothetical protein [Portunus trituberculatus]
MSSGGKPQDTPSQGQHLLPVSISLPSTYPPPSKPPTPTPLTKPLHVITINLHLPPSTYQTTHFITTYISIYIIAHKNTSPPTSSPPDIHLTNYTIIRISTSLSPPFP